MKIVKFWKYFAVLFLINFVLINWVDYGWLFNYRAMAGLTSDLFQEEKTMRLMSGEEVIFSGIVSEENKSVEEREGYLEISKINVSAPIVFFDGPTDMETISKSLDEGTVHFPTSVLPGAKGQTVILGHSAPPNWPKIKYDWVFSEIGSLEEGDEIMVNFNGREYVYRVKEKIFLDKGEDLPGEDLSSRNTLILITCWPPGKDYMRIAVIADIA